MKAILSSRNKKKIAELYRILKDHLPDLELYSLDDVGIEGEAVEDGKTFEENALLKARFASKEGYYVFADDSGLEVDALGGRPGVYSARYAGEPCDDAKNNELLLFELKDVKKESRSARYVAVLACITPSGEELVVRGTCEGEILPTPSEGNGGFGYDPLFYVPMLGKTFAEVTAEEKDAISHRGNAIRLFLDRYIDKLRGADHADE